MNFRRFCRIFFFTRSRLCEKRYAGRVWLAVSAALLVCQSANAQAPTENISQLKAKVVQFLTEEYEKSQAVKSEIKVGGMDNRLRLAKCNELELILKDPSKSGGNVNVQATCKAPSVWTILVPAEARVFRPVVVAARNLERGQIVSEDDLVTDVKDVSDFRLGFSLTPDNVVGKEIKYTVNKGEVFRNSALDAPLLIKRGDTVSMEAAAGDISVKTSGTAATDGRLGQQIRVKNNQSARVINAKVVGPGKVQSIL